jgi:tetratricopeptide (TPR) repeat protein
MQAIIQAAAQLAAQGQTQAAISVIVQARAGNPHSAQLAWAQGVLAQEARDPKQAIDAFRQAIALAPDLAQAYGPFAACLAPLGRIRLLAHWAQLMPLDPAPLLAQSHAWREAGRAMDAVELAKAALAINANAADAWMALGVAYHAQGQLTAAQTALAKALSLAPAARVNWINLSLVLTEAQLPQAANLCLMRAYHLAPGLGDAEWGIGLNLWLMGQLPSAWVWFEGRLLRPGIVPAHCRSIAQWRGEDFAQRNLLLWAEQGHGDSLQFLRYYDVVKARGGRVIVQVQPALKRLYQLQNRYDGVYAHGEAVESFDLHLAMMSAPWIFQTKLETIPAPIPYLTAPGLYELPKPRQGGVLKVGLVWAGNPGNVTADRVRSFDLETYAPILACQGVQFYSLQVGRSLPLPDQVIDLAPDLTDFAVTADALSQLDLLISSCTSVPHLAGALGKPVWLALNKASDYRWGQTGTTTPWYPTFKLYRQEVLRDWSHPMTQIAEDLAALVDERSRAVPGF